MQTVARFIAGRHFVAMWACSWVRALCTIIASIFAQRPRPCPCPVIGIIRAMLMYYLDGYTQPLEWPDCSSEKWEVPEDKARCQCCCSLPMLSAKK